MNNIKSSFDNGNWSEVNGLPGQDDMIHFYEHLLSSNPNQVYSRRDIMAEIAKEFKISATAQETDGPESNTTGYYTRVTYLITDSIQGKRRAENKPFAKRIAYGFYQHITGNGIVPPDMMKHARSQIKTIPKRLVSQAIVSVKLLKSLNWEPERIILELNTWNPEIVEAAIYEVFGESLTNP